ncbi:AFR565Cp [Eremothecium gossypii ATCC 10895]|uniref:AFR565Cp n=1 Tax=Eremothecium gossypii (strain ATCC 10895 / CBS 109.51 / FGSC 9923 / NRRL Y-1056) TaxID=284811 RepID=Q752K9_EREGS|nr:AFR565Cp [Eremothecium gossypii ATCC 10895]AAS53936.1 AFR565Cp [Eremothecium gossypii ATCC 10895]
MNLHKTLYNSEGDHYSQLSIQKYITTMSQRSPTRSQYTYLLISFASGILLSWFARSHGSGGSPAAGEYGITAAGVTSALVGFDNFSTCLKSTSLPMQFCYDGFASAASLDAQLRFGKDGGDRYQQCLANVGYMIGSQEGVTKEQLLAGVQRCGAVMQFGSKIGVVKPQFLLSRLIAKLYDMLKFVVVLGILTFQVYLFSGTLFRRRRSTDFEPLDSPGISETPSKVNSATLTREKKPTELPKNRKSLYKSDANGRPKAPSAEPENASPEEPSTNIAKQVISSEPTAQVANKSSQPVVQAKNRVIINCKEKGLVFDMTTKEGVQKWRDYVNRGKSHASPAPEKATAPTQVCLTPLQTQPVDFSRISLYDHNGKAFRRIFVPGLGWITRDRCIQLMQEQGYKENHVRGLDY